MLMKNNSMVIIGCIVLAIIIWSIPLYKLPFEMPMMLFASIKVFSVLILIIVGLMYFLNSLNIKDEKKKVKASSKLKNNKTNKTSSNFIEIVWNGKETMSKTFWLYCILITGIVSLITGMLSPLIGNYLFIVPMVVIFWSNIGLWNSSSNYKAKQLNKKKSYGWATAAKFYVVLSFIYTLSQAGFIIRDY